MKPPVLEMLENIEANTEDSISNAITLHEISAQAHPNITACASLPSALHTEDAGKALTVNSEGTAYELTEIRSSPLVDGTTLVINSDGILSAVARYA